MTQMETVGPGRALVVPIDLGGEPAAKTGASDARLAHRLLTQLAESLWLPEGLSDEEKLDRIQAAAAALEGLRPRDVLEGMLAAQMVATHSAAMDCLRRAGSPDPGQRSENMRHAGRLLGLYAKQVEVLNRNRGVGHQRVTVEHVRVESGAQAIVGQVNATGRTEKASQ